MISLKSYGVIGSLGSFHVLAILSAITMPLLLGACSSYETEVRTGVFVERTHMWRYTLRWDGGNTEGRYREICNTVTAQCFEADLALVRGLSAAIRKSESISEKMVAIYANNESGDLRDESRLQIFRAFEGDELHCLECKGRHPALGELRWWYWRHNAHLVIKTERVESSQSTQVFWIASIFEDSYTIHKVKEIATRNGSVRVGIPSMSDDGDKLAWIVCDLYCELFELKLQSGEEIRTVFSCPEGKGQGIKWSGSKAIKECGDQAH